MASIMSLRLAYAATIIRGVNGIADALVQNRSMESGMSNSVSYLCSLLGLPSWIVDLRHDASHKDLPSLIVLRLASKTLLEFLLDRYWEDIGRARMEVRNKASKLLIEYQQSVQSNKSIPEDEPGAISKDGSTAKDQKEYGSFSLFAVAEAEEKAAKKRKKNKKKKELSGETIQKRSDRIIAKEFVQEVPMEIGYESALSFLIWNSPCKDNGNSTEVGVLFPQSSPSQDNALTLQTQYSPLLVGMISAWPGFAHALLVHLIDLMLVLETNHSENDGKKTDHSCHSQTLYFLEFWIRFLLSNEFYSRLGWHDPRLPGGRRLLKIRRKNRTVQELKLMEDHAPLAVLQRAGLPLNSLCDRCLEHRKNESTLVSKMSGLLLSILDDKRCEGFGVYLVSKSPNEKSNVMNITGEIREEKPKEQTIISIQATASSSGKEENVPIEECQNDKVEALTQGESLSIVNSDVECDEDCALNSWTLCASWEPCSIGTISGYPT
jgi:ribosomal biogenesis protein LAS1